MQLSSELEASLREFAAAGPAELRENGARVAPLSTLSWEVRSSNDKPLLHLWSDNHNLTRRVLAITDHSERRLALAVECFGRSKPDRLEFLRVEFDRSERELSREVFAQSIRRLCEHEFPDESLEAITTAADLEHTLSGNYVRGVLRRGRDAWAMFSRPYVANPAAHRSADCSFAALPPGHRHPAEVSASANRSDPRRFGRIEAARSVRCLTSVVSGMAQFWRNLSPSRGL